MSMLKSFPGKILIGILILMLVSCGSTEDSKNFPAPGVTGQFEENGPMVVTVQVTEEVARVLQNQSEATPSSEGLIAVLEEMDIILKPLHPGTQDPVLITFYTVEVLDSDAAERVVNRLLPLEAIEAAYLKPPAEPASIP